MAEEKDKVINLFKKTNENSGLPNNKLFKGFPYIKLIKDENGNLFREDYLIEYAKKCYYIVSVVKKNGPSAALYKYNVPYESLISFLNEFENNNTYGRVIDIERYIPEDLA